ncbi:MAG TPA: FmdE family protein [Acidimicrobiales bacterium]|jgi:formylmethanofuran dehydrogenase subunit E|nr:FmdE family protein [Acidimicrobiales bacterium]
MSATDQETIRRIEDFHGHMCPGLAMGIRAAEVALECIGAHAADEEVVAIVETDMCGVDAIQFLTGCTFGKGNLIHLDYGKNAYTFCRRSDGRAIRVTGKARAWGGEDPEWQRLFTSVRGGGATPEEHRRFTTLHRARAERVLSAPIDDLYEVAKVDVEVPARARIHTSLPCANCGENTMETRVRLLRGRQLCPPCFEAELAGRHPVAMRGAPSST